MRSPFMLPDVAVVDPDLTRFLPRAVTASTGLDALIQCIEPFVSNKANPISDALALKGCPFRPSSLAVPFVRSTWSSHSPSRGACRCDRPAGVELGARFLLRACDNGEEDMEAREGMCMCSLLGGMALANSKLGELSHDDDTFFASRLPTLPLTHPRSAPTARFTTRRSFLDD